MFLSKKKKITTKPVGIYLPEKRCFPEQPFSRNQFSFVSTVFFNNGIILPGNSCLGVEISSQSNANVKRDTRYIGRGFRESELTLFLNKPICGSVCPNVLHC